MRLSEWRASGPSKEASGAKIAAIVDPILLALGAEPDPHCWVAWGEEPGVRFTIFVPTPAGLITSFVRVNVPGEGPRASSKLIRWARVQLGELAIETQGGHRLLSFQVEQQVIHGADEIADRIARFAGELFAAIDGRTLPEISGTKRRRARAGDGSSAGPKAGGRPAAKPATSGAQPAGTGAKPPANRPGKTAGKPAAKATASAGTSR
jgi:hypothetical protein